MSSIKLSKKKMGWDAAIEDVRKRIEKLRTALAIFEEKKKAGEPWPEAEQLNAHSIEQQHSV
jgi:hypothetical protein